MKHFILGIVFGTGVGISVVLNKQVREKIRVNCQAAKKDFTEIYEERAKADRANKQLAESVPAARNSLNELKYNFDSYQNYLHHKLPRLQKAADNLNKSFK